MRRAVLDGPVLEGRDHGVGCRQVEHFAPCNRGAQRAVRRLWHTFLLHLVVKYAGGKILAALTGVDEVRPSLSDQSRMLLAASNSAVDPMAGGCPFFPSGVN